MVSILIAARNEEANIISCLQSVSKLAYPASECEVLIGDDASEDRTASLVEAYIQDKPNFRLVYIEKTIGLAKGKANVLAQLAQQARGEYLFTTDADIVVPPFWIQTMLAACVQTTGIVSGITLVKGNKLFHLLQSLDWAYAFGLVHVFMENKIPITVMGNNMLVTREAYESVGGYEAIPFSVTEDFALFHAIVNKGFSFRHLLIKEVLAYSQPMKTLSDLLQQRKRWMAGAVKLPFYIQSIFLLQALLFPVLVLLMWAAPQIGWMLILLKLLVDTAYLIWVLHKIKELHLIKYVWVYELYMIVFSMLTLLYYFIPGTLQWKGREYKNR
ncbi:glycosyltransferase [Rhodocytophaga aerolata]|uniref:Glycosyltransferase n=1 Tax=Rhodocytophaga aerolata TaxID=455078 RepID=A0ABT8QZY4_9BACT|nr:glycosyltransferase [Rhodocytophaga aerolata]MDO1445234.1 glycosyltransferase [Rhodocytophaga aerolata]